MREPHRMGNAPHSNGATSGETPGHNSPKSRATFPNETVHVPYALSRPTSSPSFGDAFYYYYVFDNL
eukprot:3761414-Prymnesium_polylepis.1